MANNKSKIRTKAPIDNNEEFAKDLTALEKDQEIASEFQYKPAEKGMNKKQQQTPQS